MMSNVCITYKNAVRRYMCQYLENWCSYGVLPTHLKKDMIELGKIPRKAAGMMKYMTQLLQKEELSRLVLFRLERGWLGSSVLETSV